MPERPAANYAEDHQQEPEPRQADDQECLQLPHEDHTGRARSSQQPHHAQQHDQEERGPIAQVKPRQQQARDGPTNTPLTRHAKGR